MGSPYCSYEIEIEIFASFRSMEHFRVENWDKTFWIWDTLHSSSIKSPKVMRLHVCTYAMFHKDTNSKYHLLDFKRSILFQDLAKFIMLHIAAMSNTAFRCGYSL